MLIALTILGLTIAAGLLAFGLHIIINTPPRVQARPISDLPDYLSKYSANMTDEEIAYFNRVRWDD